MGKIWLIGGTSESKQLAIALSDAHIDLLVTVTTPAAAQLYHNLDSRSIIIGKLDAEGIERLITEHNIIGILDASHPFAVEISQQVIAASQHRNIPYLRFERKVSKTTDDESNLWVKRFPDFSALLQSEYICDRRVLLTIGYRHLSLFQPWQDRAVLFARLLPSVTALQAAYSAGFTPERLIALRPPISFDLELALIKQWQIDTIITKASGEAGGENTKTAIATSLHIPLLIVERPQISYPQQTSEYDEAVQFCQQLVDS